MFSKELMFFAMACLVGFGAYRHEVVDHPVAVRVIGPDGRQKKQISRACSWIWDRYDDKEKAHRWIRAFLWLLGVVHNALPADPAKRYDVAEAFVSSVGECRRIQDAFVVAEKIPTVEAKEKDGSYWLKPTKRYSRVADAVHAGCMVTAALVIAGVFVGCDPSKVDPELSRLDGERARLDRTRRGLRLDVDNRLRMAPDPDHAPRMDDPRFHQKVQEGFALTGAPEAYRRACSIAYNGGGRWMSVESLSIYDVLVGDKGRRRHYPSRNKGDKGDARSFVMIVPKSEDAVVRAWISGTRAKLTGHTLAALEVMALDPTKHAKLKAMPLLTENGVDPINYNRMWRLLRRAAVAMDLFIDDDEYHVSGRKRYVSFHYFRHEYIHRRLDRVRLMKTEAARKAEKEDIVAYMRWSGTAMLDWYSKHHTIRHASAAAEDFNDEQDAGLADAAHAPTGIVDGAAEEEWDTVMDAFG
jgi:hypothetical protein